MIGHVIAVLVLAARALVAFPDADVDRVLAAAIAASNTAEVTGIPAALLIAIAQHESDLLPNAVSYRIDGRRIDLAWNGFSRLPPRIVCGYLSAMATPASCASMIAIDGGMAAGSAELVEWLGSCRGDLPCALRGHAGGTRCAILEQCSPNAAAFAALFYRRAVALGMEDRWQRRRRQRNVRVSSAARSRRRNEPNAARAALAIAASR
jgi:hypothetical protein